MANDLTVLADHRDALLLAEVAAWLHMFGKFHEDFLGGNLDLDAQIPPDLTTQYPILDGLLRDIWPGPIWAKLPVAELGAASLSLFNLIEHHTKANAPTGFQRLMSDAHGRGSGIEKGALNRFAPPQSGVVHVASAVGAEERAPIELAEVARRRRALYDFLTIHLSDLRNQRAHVAWTTFRTEFIRRLTDDFSASVAETRRPLNDVTLFDQTAASVAFFKASLAQVLLTGWQAPEAKDVKTKYRWRILRVGLNGPAYWGQVVRVSDLRARKSLVDVALDKAQRLLEETYPLGMEVYRDENGSALIVPDVEDLLDLAAGGQSLRDQLQAIADDVLAGEVRFELRLSKATRNTLLFGALAISQPPQPTPSPRQLAQVWAGSGGRDICPVCGLRPQGPGKKALERKVCDICEQRRADRAEAWAEQLDTTIWLDEAADANGKVALVVGRFDLERWLSGQGLNTLLAFEPSARSLTDGERGKSYRFEYAAFLAELASALSPAKSRQTLGKWAPLVDDLLLANSRGGLTYLSDIYDLYVSDTDLGEKSGREAWRFALALMRQQPAFARIRRVWETTQGFWNSSLQELVTGETPVLKPVVARLRIPLTAPTPSLRVNHAYELHVGGATLAVLRDENSLITTDGLQRLARILGAKRGDYVAPLAAARFIARQLEEQKQCTIDEPSEYGRPSQLRDQIPTTSVQLEQTPYQPIIPILADPRSFMALVPADKALDVAQAVRQKYEREMGKVRNRLPLHLGLVITDARTPLRALLDAGRRMLTYRDEPGGELWQVAEDAQQRTERALETSCYLTQNSDQFKEWYEVRLRREEAASEESAELTWRAPAKMGDGATEDVWYPYVFLKTDGDDNKVAGRQRKFKAPRPGASEPTWLVHAGELRRGDVVYFSAATLDFEWLDSAAQRFEIAYGERGRRLAADRRRRPYLLDDLQTIHTIWHTLQPDMEKSNLSKTQRHALREVIQRKREEWQPDEADCRRGGVFWQFCRDAIATASWGKETQPDPDSWADYAVRGILTDTIELFDKLIQP